MNTYDVRVNLGGVVIIRVDANSKDEAAKKVNDTIDNSTLKELNKNGKIIRSISEVKNINKKIKEMER